MEFVHVASSSLIVFFLLLLLTKSGKGLADWILFAWFVLLLIHTLTFYFLANSANNPSLLFELSDTLAFLHGPFLWFYTKSLTRSPYKLQFHDAWHLIPTLISLSIFLPNFFLFQSPMVEDIRQYMTFFKLVILPVYAIYVLREILRHQRLVPQLFSSTEEKNLSWLFLWVAGILGVWLVAVVSLSLFFFMEIDIPEYGGLYTNLTLSILVFVLGFYGVRQTQVFLRSFKLEREIIFEEEKPEKRLEKYENSGLSKHEAEPMFKQVQQFISENKVYLDSQLSLTRLAEQTDIPTNHLSQVINTYGNLNFFDFINQYRVDAVKEKLNKQSHPHLTLLGIALESGFNSKASFNRAFKKFTGMTPSEYRKSLK